MYLLMIELFLIINVKFNLVLNFEINITHICSFDLVYKLTKLFFDRFYITRI